MLSYRAALLGLASISVVPCCGCPGHYTDVGIRPFFLILIFPEQG